MRRFKNKNLSAFTLVEIIVVIGIIAILSATIVPNIGKHTRSKQVSYANENAKIVYRALQRETNKLVYADNDKQATLAWGTYDGSTHTEILVVDGANVPIDLKLILPDDIRNGTWTAVIDGPTNIVQYVNWVPDYTVSTSTISGLHFTSYSDQDVYNSTISSRQKLVGSYPIGT